MSETDTVIAPSHHLTILRQASLLRERIAPSVGDYYYLHLSDLLLGLRAHASGLPLTILDFGAGGSPYRSLFPNALYKTADLEGSGSDYVIKTDGSTSAPEKHFDLVLSTQVLEHCRRPESYLDEAARVLKRDGRLILSTHGLFEEHACPSDFFRWTAEGLRSVIEGSGFRVLSMARVTAGPRAAFHLLQSALSPQLLCGKRWPVKVLLGPIFRIVLARRFWNIILDRFFPDYRVVTSGDLPMSNTYVTLLAVARPKIGNEGDRVHEER